MPIFKRQRLKLFLSIAAIGVCTINVFAQNADTATTYVANAWKQVNSTFFTFKYPADWVYKKDSSTARNLISVTPRDFSNIASIRMVEIVEVPKKGMSFEEFKKNAIGSLSAASRGKFEIFNNSKTVFKGLDAVILNVNLFAGEDFPAKVYLINGVTAYYLLQAIVDPKKKNHVKFDAVNNEIINSIKFN